MNVALLPYRRLPHAGAQQSDLSELPVPTANPPRLWLTEGLGERRTGP